MLVLLLELFAPLLMLMLLILISTGQLINFLKILAFELPNVVLIEAFNDPLIKFLVVLPALPFILKLSLIFIKGKVKI